MLQVLAIGNSFSQDATRFLSQMLRQAGVENRIANLYIGGCPLQRHWQNAQTDAPDYAYEENGESTGETVSLSQALTRYDWDVITLQQASGPSGDWESYLPYLPALAAYVKKLAPRAHLAVHQTWAYETGSTHAAFAHYGSSRRQMHAALSLAYRKAAGLLQAPLIPVGECIAFLRTKPEFCVEEGGLSLSRDGYHLSLLYGRYAAAAVWMYFLSGRLPAECGFVPCQDGRMPDMTLFAAEKQYLQQFLRYAGTTAGNLT